MPKNVLILGAGLVSQPIIDYLFENTTHTLTVADMVFENAQQAVKKNARGTAKGLDVQNEAQLSERIREADLVVSLLPYTLHGLVARHCLNLGKSMVNASYVSDEMRGFDAEAREKGLLILCETGLDPGIDHMSAMKIINEAKQAQGEIKEFISVCGGLPAPDANNNPFGYKFSWSPKGVLLAGNNDARYIESGDEKVISAAELFHSTQEMKIADQAFEAYPNRDSVPYEKTYGLEGIDLLMRGTLRYSGWHKLILTMKALNLIKDNPIAAGEYSFPELIASLNDLSAENIKSDVADKLNLPQDSPEMKALDWLGLFSDDRFSVPETTLLDILADTMNEKMAYSDGERDMVVLQHRFKIAYPDHDELVLSTLVDYGIPHGSSSMSRTVSLPLAIAVKLILNGEIKLTGVQIPVVPEIYEPILAELETFGIAFEEEVIPLENKN
jgi:saccharopine dehydrogenase (NADP+, L-glutamate forming)